LKLEEAEKCAAKVTDTIHFLCEKVLVVGSIRRRRPEVNDIDIVVIPGAFRLNDPLDLLVYFLVPVIILIDRVRKSIE
jgi:hypothetical protein